ncbi:MAG TPA: NADH-quinone oxidoreductase subunit H [Caldithrix abyssi]|uniref:NADH-quinone oxidoreductase subunit H n=1 Tax=Caldithrix abyssi TaxID=187145 RepID=A0A7V4TY59_CALAY|nr:NADH-quinone oxidoreductase subunit H [Caldithrix abyssi]
MQTEQIIWIILMPFVGAAVGLTYMGIGRKIIARVQHRYGPPIFQNIVDVLKLYSKKTAITHGVMFHLAPNLAITGTISTLMFIPILSGDYPIRLFSFQGDLLLIMYIMVFGCLAMALGAGQSGNPNSAIGVSRGLTQMLGYEIPFVIALVILMVQNNTTSLLDIIAAQNTVARWNIFHSPFAFIAAMFAFLGMMGNKPFDVPIAPAEIASGPPSEFGGKYLALMQTNRGMFAFVKLVLYTDLFLGGAATFVALLVKTFALYLVQLFVGIVNPRFRTEQSMTFFWKWPSVIGLIGLVLVLL